MVVLDALDALARVVGARQADEAHALAAVGQRLQHQLAGLLAGVDVGGADIGDALAVGRVAVGGEQGDLAADAVQRVAHGLGIDRAHHDAGDAGGDEIVHHARLDGGRRLLGILEDERVVRQLALRLLDAGFGGLPEIGRAVDDEGQGLLVRRLRGSGKADQGGGGGNGYQQLFHDRPPFFVSVAMRSSSTDLMSIERPNRCRTAIQKPAKPSTLAGRLRRYANNMKLLRRAAPSVAAALKQHDCERHIAPSRLCNAMALCWRTELGNWGSDRDRGSEPRFDCQSEPAPRAGRPRRRVRRHRHQPALRDRESFIGPPRCRCDPLHVMGVLSLIFWALILVVTVKYVLIIMRADNQGEGGSLRCLP